MAPRGRREFLETEEGQVRQRVELQVASDVLDRIELGGHTQRPDGGYLAMGAPQWRSNGISPRGFHVRRINGAIIRSLSSRNASRARRREALS